jgi:hypothetical protein
MLKLSLTLMMTFTFLSANVNSIAYGMNTEDTPTYQSTSVLDFVEYHQNLTSAFLNYSTLIASYSCHSGGDGASSCSLGFSILGCSVTCQDGYEACCSLWYGCKCIKKDSPSDVPEVNEGAIWA